MKKIYLKIVLCVLSINLFSQESNVISGTILDSGTNLPLENVNIVNLNQVIGTTTNKEGKFEINAIVNDTLHFSFLGFKSIKVKVTNDWIKFGTNTTIELTEMALALEEVVVYEMKLTGYLEVDIKQVPINDNFRYSISGLSNVGYESSVRPNTAVTKALNAIFNPVDFLYQTFGREPNQLRKLKKMKKDDQIRRTLANRFDREMLIVLLDIDKIDLDFLIAQCNYSDEFINKANDLQVLDAISECYEEYKVLNKTIKN
tara:strand:+ start:6328 stop:7104 length:777 start_codon:yes stop_codon:yes gene_type:complete